MVNRHGQPMRIGKRERRDLQNAVWARKNAELRADGVGHAPTQYQLRSAWSNFWPRGHVRHQWGMGKAAKGETKAFKEAKKAKKQG